MKLAVTAVLALSIAGAGVGSPAAADPAAGPSGASGVAWATTDALPIGRPIAVGGVAVGYVVRDRRVFARGIAPGSGTVLWEHEVGPSAQPAGVEMVPQRVGDLAVLLRPETTFGRDHARLSVVDPASGREVHGSPAMLFSSPPESCFGARSVCAVATPELGEPGRGYRLNLDSGAFIPFADGAPRNARALGPAGLVAVGERVALLADGVVRWQEKFSEVLPGVDARGSRWGHDAGSGVYTGSGYRPGVRAGAVVRLDLGRDALTAGVDAATGTVLWRQPGTIADCGGRISVAGLGVRCRYRGVVSSTVATKVTSDVGVRVTVEGFDRRSGKARWVAPIGVAGPAVPTSDLSARSAGGLSGRSARSARSAADLPGRSASSGVLLLAVGDGRVPIAGSGSVVVEGNAGPMLLNLRTGATAKPVAGAVMWCPKRTRFGYRESGPARTGGDIFTTCNAAGSPVTGTPPLAATSEVAAVVGGFAVVPTRTGFQGVRILS